jgi:hypothetical protein
MVAMCRKRYDVLPTEYGQDSDEMRARKRAAE